jgi:hypothetical protein
MIASIKFNKNDNVQQMEMVNQNDKYILIKSTVYSNQINTSTVIKVITLGCYYV